MVEKLDGLDGRVRPRPVVDRVADGPVERGAVCAVVERVDGGFEPPGAALGFSGWARLMSPWPAKFVIVFTML